MFDNTYNKLLAIMGFNRSWFEFNNHPKLWKLAFIMLRNDHKKGKK